MLTWLRSRVVRAGHDAGLTLIELVVAMVLATVLGSMAMAWFLGASDASTATTDADLGTASARNVLQTWAALLRVAGSPTDPGSGTDRITSLSATSITFNAYVSGAGSCTGMCTEFATKSVTLAMTGADCGQSNPRNCQLVETGAGSNSSATDVIVPSGVSAGTCLFTAYDTDGSSLGCTGLSSDELASVTGIGVAFAVTTDGHPRSFQTSAAFTQRPGSSS
jgi:prepilin-type N-terminal cleavage/methylation domain-containing protein